jgi:DUF177 domain-containing protein
MRIELANLEGGKGEFAHSYEPGELTLEDERLRLVGGPKVSGRIHRDGRRVRVSGSVAGHLQVECDRCLKPVDMPVNSRFKLEYVSPEEYESQHAVELGEDDLDLSVYDGEAIDIDALVAEELLLAVPDQVFCKSDCKGLCPVCGADRNSNDCGCETAEVDPRWAGLKELVNRE